MSVYTPVDPDALAEPLANRNAGPLLELEGIAGGVENTNYRLATPSGRYVLTLFERQPQEDLPFFMDLMTHLAGRGIPCPRPLRDAEGGAIATIAGKPACLVTFLEGEEIEAPAEAHCAAVGDLLARLHLASREFPAGRENPRGAGWRRTTAQALAPLLGAEDRTLLEEEVRFQSLYRLEDLPRGIVHADLFRDNVLWTGDRLSGAIDFYFACTDAWLLDLAVVANDWCIDPAGDLDPERTRALLSAYHRLRPLTPLERGAWPAQLRAAALRFWLSRLADLHMPRQGALVTRKDPAEFRRILDRRIAAHPMLPRLWV